VLSSSITVTLVPVPSGCGLELVLVLSSSITVTLVPVPSGCGLELSCAEQ
jgi:hypothetical protein